MRLLLRLLRRRLSLRQRLSLGRLEPLLVVVVKDVALRSLLRAPRLVPLDVSRVHLLLKLLNLLLSAVGTVRALGLAAVRLLSLGDDAVERGVHFFVVERGFVHLPPVHEFLERLVAEGELREAKGDVARGLRGGRECRLGEPVGELVREGLRLPVLVDEPEEPGHDLLEDIRRQLIVSGEAGEQIREEVVNRVAVLARQLVEQQPRHGRDARVRVLEAPRHLRDVTLHLHHVVQHQVRQHRHRVLPHAGVRVVQRVTPLPHAVEVLRPRLDRVGEPER